MWKYEVLVMDDYRTVPLRAELERMGKDNWELVQILNYGSASKHLIFKKFLTEEEYILNKIVGEE